MYTIHETTEVGQMSVGAADLLHADVCLIKMIQCYAAWFCQGGLVRTVLQALWLAGLWVTWSVCESWDDSKESCMWSMIFWGHRKSIWARVDILTSTWKSGTKGVLCHCSGKVCLWGFFCDKCATSLSLQYFQVDQCCFVPPFRILWLLWNDIPLLFFNH